MTNNFSHVSSSAKRELCRLLMDTHKETGKNDSSMKIIATLCIITTILLLIYLHQHYEDFIQDRLIPTRYPTIYFINTNPNDKKLKLRTLCAIESASLHNPDFLIKFYTLSPLNSMVSTIINQFQNVQSQLTTAESILKDTPLSEWYHEGDYKNGPYQIIHTSDAMRLALIWKQGGIYMDTDIWSVRGLSNMSNTIAREDDTHVNGAVMIFDKHHPFLYDCMVQFVLGYAKDQFTAQGPGLLTRVMINKCRINGTIVQASPREIHACLKVHVLPPKTFYPVPFVYWRFLFRPVRTLYTWKSAYTFHLWNKLSGKVVAKIGNKLFVEELAKKNCPTIYKLMVKRGKI